MCGYLNLFTYLCVTKKKACINILFVLVYDDIKINMFKKVSYDIKQNGRELKIKQ